MNLLEEGNKTQENSDEKLCFSSEKYQKTRLFVLFISVYKTLRMSVVDSPLQNMIYLFTIAQYQTKDSTWVKPQLSYPASVTL